MFFIIHRLTITPLSWRPPTRKMEEIFFFCLREGLMWRTLVGGRLYGGNVVFGLRGDHLRLSSLHPPIGKSACR